MRYALTRRGISGFLSQSGIAAKRHANKRYHCNQGVQQTHAT
jgi:hypothetical protein